MAAKTDLTWQELQTALTELGYGNAIAVVEGKVMIDVGALSGDVVDGMADTGVSEFLYKFRQGAGTAQENVNEGLETADQLTSFPPFSYGNPTTDGFIPVTQVSSFRIPLNLNNVFGTNA